MKKAIVVGSGAGGATAAKELQGAFDVTLLEAGKGSIPNACIMALPHKGNARSVGEAVRRVRV